MTAISPLFVERRRLAAHGLSFVLTLLFLFPFCAGGRELPVFTELVNPGKEWVLKHQGKKKSEPERYSFTWTVFVNTENGDLLTVAADRYEGSIRVADNGGAAWQTATDMFTEGYCYYMPHDEIPSYSERGITDELRYGPIKMGIKRADGKRVEHGIWQYSRVYEANDSKKKEAFPNLLGHGYIMALDDVCYFIQHTSTHVITSELAMETARRMMSRETGGAPKLK